MSPDETPREDEAVEETAAEETPAVEETPEAAAPAEEPEAEEAKAEEKPKPKRTRKPSAQPEPAKRPARNGRKAEPAVTVRAQAKYVRSSARKARLVCEHLPGKSVADARTVLALSPRTVAQDWSKVLESAIANAENNHELIGDELTVWRAYADEGPTLKRFQPRAMGRASRIRKRTSHLTILLAPRAPKE
jgi:ribosomal protein L22